MAVGFSGSMSLSVCIAYMHTLHFAKTVAVSMEAQLILNKLKVYKTLCIQVKIMKKETKNG